jgi:hypothetical protein
LVAWIGVERVEASPVYWSLFNIEGEFSGSAEYVTYASLADMLTDQNRVGVFTPDAVGFGRNIVGSGAAPERLVSTVSIPATLPLLGIGLAGLSATRLRKSTNAAAKA